MPSNQLPWCMKCEFSCCDIWCCCCELSLGFSNCCSCASFYTLVIIGDPVKVAAVNIESSYPPGQRFERLSCSLTGLLPYLSGFDDIILRHTLLWKLKLLKSAAAYANSRLHAVKAEVLVLASGKDNMLPSRDEAERLKNSLQDCVVRHFKDNDGHTLLLLCENM